ncbi:protein ANTI-SILENCING 1-like [Bidens hawaiensis]|uniref:protein ANTI-SILENCING 1-like n=1 Tax=Bidens hawaiensis TaxID=980011 RepID=UPI00404901F9
MEKVNEDDNLDFKWLKKRGVVGKNKEIRFYESFIYDGVEYMLYDCVYLYKEGLQEPYIGKLVKIWEHSDKSKKVKIHWFFRPEEISNWLGETKTLENEVFFASGEGCGLAKINPLEAIAGKCNVVCVSNDIRNPQPSDEEVKAADFIFHRLFDVESCTILGNMGNTDKVGGLEIKYIFNRKEGENSDTKEDTLNTIISGETQKISTKPVPNTLKEDTKEDPQSNDMEFEQSHDQPFKKIKSNDKCVESGTASGSEKLTDLPSKVDEDKMKVSIPLVEKMNNNNNNNNKRNKSPTGSDKSHDQPSKKLKSNDKKPPEVKPVSQQDNKVPADNNMKVSIPPVEKVDNNNNNDKRNMTPTGSDKSHDQPSKKLKSNDKRLPEVKPVSKQDNKVPADVNNLKASGTFETTENQKNGKMSGKVTDDSEGKTVKRTKDDGTFKVPNSHKTWVYMNEKEVGANSALSKGKSDSIGNNNINMEPKEEQSAEKKNKVSVNKPLKAAALPTDKEKKNMYQELVFTRKPTAETSNWFKQLPWEDRLKDAYDKGTAVLLHNLKPDYTSEDVEGIIWTAFKENCEAKILPRTAISSPHYDQALILLKTKEAAQKILTELDEGCLLSDERPLVGTPCPPVSTKKNPTFFGHLAVSKAKFQNQREDEAVSTSHFSQPNTIEYDMAMEWCAQQLRSKKWWAKLHKQHGIELKKLEKELKQTQP